MDLTHKERLRLGLFLALAGILVFGTVASLIAKELLSRDIPYQTEFRESVDGLSVGAKVKLQGVEVGRVVGIEVNSKDLGAVRVHFEVRRGTPIKPGMRANLLGGISVTGLRSIELTGGDPTQPDLPEDALVPAGTSQLKQLSGQAEQIALKAETVMNNLLSITSEENQANFAILLRSVARLSYNLDTTIEANKGRLMSTPAQIQRVIAELDTTAMIARRVAEEIRVAHLAEGVRKTVDKYGSLADAAQKKVETARIQESLKAIEDAARAMETASKRLDITVYRAQDDLQNSMRNLRETMENMSDFSRQIKENPSLLLRGEEKTVRQR